MPIKIKGPEEGEGPGGLAPLHFLENLKKIRKVLHLISFVDTRLRMFFYSRPQKGIIDRVR